MAPKGREPLRPALPANLLKQIGGGGTAQSSGSGRSRGPRPTRKELRKQERVQKRKRNAPLRTIVRKSSVHYEINTAPSDDDDDDDEDEKEDKKPVAQKNAHKGKGKKHVEPQSEEFSGFSDEEEDTESENERSSSPAVSKTIKAKLAKEDAEIAELERKLGIKKRKTLPKSFQEDGLNDLLAELAGGDEDDDEETTSKKKRKAEADEWLAQKRRKAMPQPANDNEDESEDDLNGLDNALNAGSDIDLNEYDEYESGEDEADNDDDDDDVLDKSSEGKEREQPVQKRENPYVAPTTTATESVQKYVPPARRQEAGTDAELLARIRRQTQGLINRLTESNLLSILGDIEKLYRDYPRQHVTSILVDLILVQICEPTSLPDTLLILHAGFSTAVYKVIGPDFGAQLIQHTVEKLQDYHAQACGKAPQDVSKHTSNLITFLAEIYNFQLMGCNLIFDYIRLLLNDLSEVNAELLLRIVRMAGQLLRHDDPLALKDIVTLMGPAVKKVGEANLSVRTKFMIETINDLKNNKVKTGVSASTVIQNHTTRMKKLLGSLNSRKLKATEPLRIGLKDIEDSDKRGKWWLVGASWVGRDGPNEKKRKDDGAADDDSDGTDSVILGSDDEAVPDLAALAREQSMNTDVRRSVFIAIMSASDYKDAYARVMKLRLNKDRQKEVAYVVMQCAGCEQQYNPYYSLIARRLCGDRRIKFAFQDSLWKFFRRLGESTFGEDADDDEEEEAAVDVRRIFILGKMFGFLIANGALGLGVLKCLNLTYLRPKTQNFVEVVLITLFLEVTKAGNDVAKVFAAVADLPELAKGLQYFLKKKVQKSDLVGSKKDAKAVKCGCQTAVEALTIAPQLAT